VIAAGKSLSFVVSLMTDVKDRLIFSHENDQQADMSMHRFLVQGVPIDNNTFKTIANGSSDVRTSELANVWKNVVKEGVSSRSGLRLKVDFRYAPRGAGSSSGPPSPERKVSVL